MLLGRCWGFWGFRAFGALRVLGVWATHGLAPERDC